MCKGGGNPQELDPIPVPGCMALRSDLLWASVTRLFCGGKGEGAELYFVMPSNMDNDDAVVSFHSVNLGHLWKEILWGGMALKAETAP